jgi:hypothetical protein
MVLSPTSREHIACILDAVQFSLIGEVSVSMKRGQTALLHFLWISDRTNERICIGDCFFPGDVVYFKGNAVTSLVENGNRVEELGVNQILDDFPISHQLDYN